MKNKKILISFLVFFIINCKEKEITYYSEITKIVEIKLGDKLKEYDVVYIIPGSGCTGCINSAEKFFIENVSNERCIFIFTYYFSRKNLILRLKKENFDRKNVLIDDENIFYLEKYNEKVFPIAIELENNRVSKVYNF